MANIKASLLVFQLACVISSVRAIPIDNGVVGDPKVECTGEQVSVSFGTQKSFAGRVFVKGFSAQKECVVGSSDKPPVINLSFTQCGVQRSRQLSPPGMVIYTTIVISFHPIFVTKVDRAYRITCFYMEASKTVTADLDVSMLTTFSVTSLPSMPECRYEILTGGATGQPAKFARIGEPVYHKWTCDSKDNSYCMRVHSCMVDDGQGGESFAVLNREGCATDRFILQNLEYLTDLMAGQEAHVVKFADKTALYFSCQVELLTKVTEGATCVFARPNCTESAASVSGQTPSSGIGDAAAAAARRRLARRSNFSNKTDDSIRITTSHPNNKSHNLKTVGELDLLRQHLFVFDLDEAPEPESFNDDPELAESIDFGNTHVTKSADSSYPTISTQSAGQRRRTHSRLSDRLREHDESICISPVGFGFALAGLVAIFVIALSTAVRYIAPRESKYDPSTMVSAASLHWPFEGDMVRV